MKRSKSLFYPCAWKPGNDAQALPGQGVVRGRENLMGMQGAATKVLPGGSTSCADALLAPW